MTELSEASMNFDAELVEPFVQRVSSLLTGFGPAQIAQVLDVLEELRIDEERELAFEVMYQHRVVPLKVRIFKDDVDAPDLYFLTEPELAMKIDEAMKDFCEEHGI